MASHEDNAEQNIARNCWSRVYNAWEYTQVSHRGAYTTRRARALENYCHSVSLLRVLAVCVLTPLPILGFVLAVELLPLNPPSAGWRTNSGWIVRYIFVFNLLSLSCLQQATSFLTTLNVTVAQGLAIAWITVSCYFIVLLTIMAVWVFPIPFVFELTGGVFGVVFMGCVVMILGRQALAKTPKFTAQIRVLYKVSAVQGAMCFVYPIFSAVFNVVDGIQQDALIIVLYCLKVVTRLAMANACCSITDEEDKLRSQGSRNGWCSQPGSQLSIWAIGLLVSIDIFTSSISVGRLLRRPRVVLVSSPPKGSNTPYRSQASVMPLNGPPVAALSKLPIMYRVTRKCIVSVSNIMVARRSLSRVSGRSISRSSRQSYPRSRIVLSQRADMSEKRNPKITYKPKCNNNFVRFQTLSMTEYFILVRYVSCMIPGMVGIYTTVLAKLPNATYYSSLANATPTEDISVQRRHLCDASDFVANGIRADTSSEVRILCFPSTWFCARDRSCRYSSEVRDVHSVLLLLFPSTQRRRFYFQVCLDAIAVEIEPLTQQRSDVSCQRRFSQSLILRFSKMVSPPLLAVISRALPPSIQAIPHILELVNDFLLPLTIDAAVYNDIHRVLRVYGTCRPWTAAMDGAASRGRLDVVQWLHENRSQGCSVSAFTGASANGHLDVLKWFIDHCPREYRPLTRLTAAAEAGQLLIVQNQRRHAGRLDLMPAVEAASANGMLRYWKC